MIGLVDCNNFFVSCERLFNPSLEGKPVVVLSNNDGCIISRSNEAKDLGIPMGLPAFKIKEYTNPKNVIILSSRHVLYRDISDRIMSLLGNEVEYLQIYSIDECFFYLPYLNNMRNYEFAKHLVQKIRTHIGIPVSIGIAPSKTLAKIASHIAKKKRNNSDNIYLLNEKNNIEETLKDIPVGDVWGVGRKLNEAFKSHKIHTAYDLSKTPLSWIRLQFSIVEERTVRELNGENCKKISDMNDTNKSIMVSRSFGTLISNKQNLWEAVAYFTSCCAEKLRSQGSTTQMISVFIKGDIHNDKIPFYSNSCNIYLETPSYDTTYLTQQALRALNSIFRDGYKYKKAGVILSHLQNKTEIQLNFFENIDISKQKRLMNSLDKINNTYGKGTLFLATQGIDKKWSPKNVFLAKQEKSLRIFSGMICPRIKKK